MKVKLSLIALTLALMGYICAPFPGVPAALAGAALLSLLFSLWKKDRSLRVLAAVLLCLALVAGVVFYVLA